MSETTWTTEKEAEDFDVRLDRLIARAGKIAVREYQLCIQPALCQIDQTNAGIQHELVKNHCSEEVYQAFTESWDKLKRLIHEIENRRETADGRRQSAAESAAMPPNNKRNGITASAAVCGLQTAVSQEDTNEKEN